MEEDPLKVTYSEASPAAVDEESTAVGGTGGGGTLDPPDATWLRQEWSMPDGVDPYDAVWGDDIVHTVARDRAPQRAAVAEIDRHHRDRPHRMPM